MSMVNIKLTPEPDITPGRWMSMSEVIKLAPGSQLLPNCGIYVQAQDRCHRIGQTREVHIYRLVSEKTIEENILIKSDQKRHLDFLAIQSGGFTTDSLQKFNPQDLLGIKGAPRGLLCLHSKDKDVL